MLSSNARKALEIACPQNRGSSVGAPGSDGAEIANAIDAASAESHPQAADVPANSPASAVTVTTSGGNTYSDSAINAALASVVTDINADRSQINAILTALKNAGLMA